MFLRCSRRKKDGKLHEYWSIVENRRLGDGRVAQRHVLYLGEIAASQRKAWRKTIEVHEQGGARRQVALFPAGSMPCDDVDAIGVRLAELWLERPRQWGACWLALQLWQQLGLDEFWRPRLRPSREGTLWLKVLKTLVAYRLIDPGDTRVLPSLWHVTRSAASAHLVELSGFPISGSSPHCNVSLEQGSFPRPALPGVISPTSPSATLKRLARLLTQRWLAVRTATPQGFPCCYCLPLSCMPSSIPRRNRWVHVSLTSPSMAAFPEFPAGQLPRYPFRGLLDVHSRYGLHDRQIP